MSESDPRILIVSDVHLGALNSNLDQFSLFLDKIINGEFGDYLQALLILGDFLDLGTTVKNTFLTDERITSILTQLLEIKKKIPIIFAPGNHEIPVTSSITSDFIDEKFNRRKEKFLKIFMNTIVGELFETNMVCQYILLSIWENESALLLYDSQDQIYSHPIQEIKIGNLDLKENYKCLMVHGYQFEADAIRIFVAPFWKSMLSYQNIEIKEVYNYFWNVIIKEERKIKPITIEDMKSDLIRLKQASSEEIDSIFSDLSNLEFSLIKLNMKVMNKYRNTRRTSYYIDGIKEFFEEAECDFSLISHVIYGHSHIKGISNETIHDQKIEVINSGMWEHSNTSYVEILYGGKINLKSFNS
ncbi:MAG: metallophosphoesterase [Candidatus Lokiarchaeota archaeon]|nr:metallophosphoesterase [Candidatus Lokiarchaeota archaeon]